ncbi:outer membrane lipoprotein carrier protein LolA [Sandaracinobacter sp. RS1-74]|uniref:LolA family protein n=1 Tax=Sandaracinobacteroides sayramensis TaxID=2913411 RepID=UPI001EDC08B6|nr:outer membrane lipoprotein carrier protein LolA [Sandaracinobacteroides sayramensis]MCG2841491.1 outer membrane lipoprotein carrier protein LolA [Sandaracinobacteroides sayramensis]
MTSLSRRLLLALGAAALIFSPAVAATELKDVERALSATTSLTADFRQTAADGRVASGRMQLKRPGRIRFDYGNDARHLVVADGQLLSFVDYKVSQVSQWPIRSTPLGVLLDPKADLSRIARVLPAGESPVPGQIAVEAQDPKRPDFGRILFFLKPDGQAPGGLSLTGWRVTDAQNNLTVVELRNMQFNPPVADSAFRFRDPRPARSRIPGKTN